MFSMETCWKSLITGDYKSILLYRQGWNDCLNILHHCRWDWSIVILLSDYGMIILYFRYASCLTRLYWCYSGHYGWPAKWRTPGNTQFIQSNVVYRCYSGHYGWPAKRSTESNPLLPGSKRLHYHLVPPQRAYRPVSAHGLLRHKHSSSLASQSLDLD